ncbi:Tyrosine-protein kinase Abl [Aphelenchoides bicaudatus]|nr:Tyrosine-protein kinase Abl [Aphelenchoides bicaudatus]
MRSFYKFATLFLFFHNIIFLSHIKADPTSNVKIDEPIRSMASNGEILGIVLPNKIHFYSLISSSPSQTLLNDLFSMKFNEIEFKEDFNFELLPDNRFVLCLVDSCRLYQIHPAEKTVSLLFNATSDVPFSTWAAIILDDKLLVSYLPSVKPNSNAVIKSFSLDGGNAMGKADDYVAIFQEKKVQGFERNGYSYFVNTVFEHDLYSDEIKRSYDNITRTRLTRICSDDNSQDLVTKINIHLACGTQPADYWSFPEQHFESSFLSTDKERLFVLFRSKDNGYISCSYSMTEIDSYFAKVWTACQTIESHDMFQDECILNRKAEFCSFTWKRSSSSSNCQRFGIGYTKKRFNNCAVSRETQTLGRNAWIENFFPVWGNTENKFSEAQILAGLDQNTFMAFSESKALKRIQVNTPQQLPLWDKKADRFITVLANSTHPAHIIYSVNNQVQAQRVTCAALYSDCEQIRWDDPLECMYCSFANSSGYVSHLSVENNRTCEQAEGKVIVNQCPPVISSVTIGSSDVTVVGDYLTNFKDRPKVSVCDTDCEIFTFQLNAITCKLNDISPTCEVRIVGDLESVKDYSIYHTNSNGDDLNLDGEDQTSTTSSSKSAGRATKFIVGIVAALFLLTIVIIIGYIIMTKKCTQNNNHSIPSKPFIPDLGSNALSDPYPYNSISTTEVIDPEYNMELYGIMAFDHNKIEKINTIGKGNFSRVFKYRYKDAPFEEVAVKEIWDGDMREVKLISRCQHPNIVSYYGYFRRENNICLVMEFLDGGDLHKYST